MANMREKTRFSAVVIGNTALMTACVQHLLAEGHDVRAVVIDDPDQHETHMAQGIPVEVLDCHLAQRLSAEPFDYLFSIANLTVLPQELIDLPRVMAINYHDALLPRHAGLFATSWAILDDETSHGVTWHVMTPQVDAGDVLQQQSVTVDLDDTTWSLNSKCFAAALHSFRHLVAELAEGVAKAKKQDLSLRTYHGRFDGPPNCGILTWDLSAEAMTRLVRCTDFGPYVNSFGLCLLKIGADFARVGAARVGEERTGVPAGTLLALGDDWLVIATLDRDIHFSQFEIVDGDPLSIPALISRCGLKIGDRFPDVSADELAAWVQAHRTAIRNERYWLAQLQAAAPLDLNWENFGVAEAASTAPVCLPTNLGILSFPQRETLGLAVLLAFLARIGCSGSRLTYRSPRDHSLAALLSADLPLIVPALSTQTTLNDVARDLAPVVSRLAANGLYLRTIRARHPHLRAVRFQERTIPPFVVVIVDVHTQQAVLEPGAGIRVEFCPTQSSFRFIASVDLQVAALLQQYFVLFLAHAHPDSLLMGLPLMDDVQERTLLVEWQGKQIARNNKDSVPHLVEQAIGTWPNRIAVRHDQITITYRELGARIGRRKAELCELGIRRGDMVGVFLHRTVELPVTLLAILALGAAYVPLDPVFPPARLARIAKAAHLSAILTQQDLIHALAQEMPRVLLVDALGAGQSQTGASGKDFDAIRFGALEPDTLAYVVFTSGTTGTPKGVAVSHAALSNLLLSMAEALPFSEQDRLSSVTTITFDIAALELFLPLINGAELDLVARDVADDAMALRQHLEAVRPSVMQATPATWQMLIAAGWQGNHAMLALCGGEKLSGDLADTLSSRVKAAWNMYGPTETTIWSSMARIWADEAITIGRPIANTQFLILDDAMQLLPPGVVGQLFIGGAGLAAGYYGQPELTAQSFISSPFDGQRLYRTGDRAAWTADGQVLFLGRLDTQTKLHGYRIELGEVETLLRGADGVMDAYVQIREIPSVGPELVAHVVCDETTQLLPDLRGLLRAQLPAYAVPSRIIKHNALPRLANGKLDMKALQTSLDTQRVLPLRAGHSVEETIAAIWRTVLHTDQVRNDENFFDAGGNSLLLTQLVVRLNAAFNADVRRMHMFQFPTIAAMARHILGDNKSFTDCTHKYTSSNSCNLYGLLKRRGRM
ncbi:amino acid adenylation domain-containing protein [Rhizobium sp.]|jgi:amino acid adenylation domain-containing protein|uniref:amino acid adenylation domain-containing protein n=1 Tax=Rhizobium sp. TaxID=391 RepID=UPI000E846321|nr:hypothetical protein [Rhizobium sp.]